MRESFNEKNVTYNDRSNASRKKTMTVRHIAQREGTQKQTLL